MNAKENISRTALKLFVEKGYHSTSIPDIVSEAGVSTGALYHHFESKEALARFIHELASEEFVRQYEEKVKTEKTFYGKVKAFTRMMLTWDEEDPVIVKYLITERPSFILNRKASVCSEEGMKKVGEMISEGLASQEIEVDNYFVAISIISGTIIHFINLKKDGYINGNISEKADMVSEHIYKAMKKD